MNFKITLGVAVVICTLVSIESITLPASGLEPTYVPHSEHMYVPKSGSENLIQAPHGIDIDTSGNIYISDSNNFIEKFDSNGKFITKWGSNGTGNGQFLHPHDVAVDPSGFVYVGDYYIPNIQKFDSNGKFITKWGSKGNGDGKFNHNHYIAVDSSGSVYEADRDNGYFQKFDSNGKFITKWGSKGNDGPR